MSRTKIGILLMLFPLCLRAQQRMSVEELVNYALDNSYTIIESRYQTQLSGETKKEAYSALLPQASAKVDYRNNFELPVMYIPGEIFGAPGDEIEAQFGKEQTMEAGISVNAQLFNLYSIYSASTAKKAEELQKMAEVKTEEDVVYNIYTLYYNFLLLHKSKSVIENNLASMQELYSSTSGLVESGLALKTDLDRIYLIISNLETSKQNIENNLSVMKKYLGFYAGIENASQLDIDTTGSESVFVDNDFIDWRSNDFTNEDVIDYQLLNKQLEINNYQLKSQKSKYLPVLNAYYINNYQAQSDEFNFLGGDARYNNYSLGGLQLNIPLFTGGRTNANVQKAKVNLYSTQNKIKQVEESIQIEQEKAIDTYETNFKTCYAQGKNKTLAYEIYKQTELKYREGLASLTDVLLAENDLRESELEYAKSCLDLKASELEILKVTGNLKTLINN